MTITRCDRCRSEDYVLHHIDMPERGYGGTLGRDLCDTCWGLFLKVCERFLAGIEDPGPPVGWGDMREKA